MGQWTQARQENWGERRREIIAGRGPVYGGGEKVKNRSGEEMAEEGLTALDLEQTGQVCILLAM